MRSVAWILLVAGTAGCGSSGSDGGGESTPAKSITVGALIDRTGSNANPTWTGAVDMAFSDMNAALKSTKHRGLQFAQVSGDTASNAMTSVQRAQELVKTKGARALIADISLVDVAVNALNYASDPTQRLGVPVVCFACTSAAINNPMATDMDPQAQAGKRDEMGWNWRTAMLTAYQAPVLMQILLHRGTRGDVNNDGVFKISIFATNEAFGQSLSKAIKDAAAALHPNPPALVEQIWLDPAADPNSHDWSADLKKLVDNFNEDTKVADGAPDAVFNTVFLNYSIALIKAYAQGGYTVPLVAGDTLRRRTALDVLGATANGQEGTSPVVAEAGPSGEVFRKELMAATNLTPSGYDAQAYDAAVVSLLASLIASQPLADPALVTPEQIRDALGKVNDPAGQVVRTGADELVKAIGLIAAGKAINYEGASGSVNFDANRTSLGKIARWKVENKQFVDYEQYDCARGKDCPAVQ